MKKSLVFVALPLLSLLCAAQAPPASAGKSVGCKAVREPLTPAQIEMEQNSYKKAAEDFTSELAAHPDSARLRAWQIRNLIEMSGVKEASAKANAWVAEQPGVAAAMTAKAEVMVRQGTLPEAYALAAQSQKVDPCNGRTYFVLGEYENMIGLFATEKRHMDLAHALDPNDDGITSAWISLRPRAESIAERIKFVDASPVFTAKRREDAKKSLAKTAQATAEECSISSAVKEQTVPFSAIRSRPDAPPEYGLEMSFNGKKRRLQLDTGASGLLLTYPAAERLGLAIEDTVYVGGLGDEGNQKSQRAHVAKLKIGDLEFSNCVLEILPPRSNSSDYSMLDDVDGLVGGDIFRKFLLTLDYPAGELKLSQLPPRPNETDATSSLNTEGGEGIDNALGTTATLQDRYRAPEMQDWSQFYRIGHYLLIPTQLNDGAVKLMMADTGASENLIDPDIARTVTKVSTTNRISMAGLSGEADRTHLTDKIVLHFSKLYLPLASMVSVSTARLSRGAGVEIAGFLGFPALKQMTLQIDYRDDLINFKYDPKRPVNSKFQSDAFTRR